MAKFVERDQSHMYLLPVDMRHWVPEEDLSHFVVEAVNRVPMSAFVVNERGCHSAQSPSRFHDGKVMVIRSNLRWCSKVLELLDWNGETVPIAFVIDAHDREIVAWRAVVGMGISGSQVRDLMLETVEKRFSALRAPMAVEWLSDNGSPYTAEDTRDFATRLNLVSCFTPVASPESNGLAEAFVRTFKRDYARLNSLPDAGTLFGQLGGWFNDYNHNHPRSGFGMRSPREFIPAQQPAKVSG